jgi:hypothetical protein
VSEELSGASTLIGDTVKRLEDIAGTQAMKLTEISKTTKKQEEVCNMVEIVFHWMISINLSLSLSNSRVNVCVYDRM